MNTISTFTTPGITFLLTLVFGLWLGLTGKPYNGILFNVHKLIALGAVIVTAIQVNKALKSVEIQPLLLALIAMAALGVVALFATGALMSLGKLPYPILRALHIIAPLLVVGTLAGTIYLLIS
jgi:hypothetical protein